MGDFFQRPRPTNVGAVAANDFRALTDIQEVRQTHGQPQLRRRWSWPLPKVTYQEMNVFLPQASHIRLQRAEDGLRRVRVGPEHFCCTVLARFVFRVAT